MREVCAELAGTGIPVGIIPAGTGNLLARNLDIPLFLRAAIDIALTGQDRAIDMVKVSGDGVEDGTHFMVMAGMGFDAAIMEGVNEDIKAKVGWIAYVLSALKSLMFPAVRVEVSIDGGEFTTHRARTIVVGNVGYLQAGMPLLPDASIDDGLLDVVLLHPRRFLSWIPLAFRVLAKRPRTDELVNRMTGRTVVVRASADTPASSTVTRSAPAASCRWSASTAGCWCACPAEAILWAWTTHAAQDWLDRYVTAWLTYERRPDRRPVQRGRRLPLPPVRRAGAPAATPSCASWLRRLVRPRRASSRDRAGHLRRELRARRRRRRRGRGDRAPRRTGTSRADRS